MSMRSSSLGLVLSLLAGLASCTDEGEGDNTTSTGPTTSSSDGADGGNGAGTNGGGGAGGTGGTGGGPDGTCLDASKVAAGFFTLEDSPLCIVDVLTADGLALSGYGTAPTWGSHGGPLTYVGNDTQVTLQRWSDAGDGTLDVEETSVTVDDFPNDGFWGTTAVEVDAPAGEDCPASTVVALAWSGTDFENDGGLVTVAGDSAVSEPAAGVFGMTAVNGRLFYTGLSSVAGPTNGVNALYAADARATCGPAGFDGAPAIAAWGLASGPVASDWEGNVFAVETDYETGTQELRGFAGATVEPGDAPVAGDVLLTFPGFGDALSVVPPSADPGILVYQANLAEGTHDDVRWLEYSVDKDVVSATKPALLLDLAVADDNVVLFTDELGRLWVGLSRQGPDDGFVSTFFVLARKPAE